jgi:hypothetical protein
MLFRVLVSILLLAVYLPGVYGAEEVTITESLFVDSEGYIGSNSTDEKVDYSDISDSSSSNEISEANSSEIVDEVVESYIEDYEDALNWDISGFIDSFAGCFEGFPD